MNKKNKNKNIRKALGFGLFVFIFISLLGFLFASMPPPITISRIITVLVMSLFLAIGRFWNIVLPESWLAQLVVYFGLTFLFLIWTIHCLTYGIIGANILIWLIPLVAAYIIAWTLPIYNPSVAKVINDEQFTPKTKVGRVIFNVALSVVGSAGAIGAGMGRYLYREMGFQPVLLIMGIILSFSTTLLSQTFAYQVYTKRLREMEINENYRNIKL